MPDDEKNNEVEVPAPEVLQAYTDTDNNPETPPAPTPEKKGKLNKLFPKRTTYRPSHKATFIGLAVILGILAVNGVIIYFVIQGQNKKEEEVNRTEVTLSSETLNELGVSRNTVGTSGVELTIGPDTTFNGTVTISGNTTVGGSLTLNGTFNASEGAFSRLQGGETTLTSLNVNQDTTTSNLNIRDELVVAGAARFQGTVVMSQLVTVNNNLNVTGSLAVGGTLSVRNLAVASLSTDTTLTIGGKVITRGSPPSVAPGGGGALGSNGTVSISGTDTAGTIGVNIGVGASGGTLASVTFRSAYSSTPKVLVTAVGGSAGAFYINRSSTGFSIHVPSGMSPGGYAFDYWIVQ